MDRRTFVRGAAGLATMLVLPGAATAQQVKKIKLAMGASHPTGLIPVGVMVDWWAPRVNALLRERRTGFEIDWTFPIGGSLYKFRETRTAVRDGLVDGGWVGTIWESSAMPLASVTYYAPFVTGDVVLLHKTYDRLVSSIPEMLDEWTRNNLLFLGSTGGDSYHLFMKVPVRSLDDVKGKKISTPGASANILRNTGAIAVDSAITNFYTDVQTGVTDGALSFYTGILPTRLYEVTRHITEIDSGAMIWGGLAFNRPKFDSLPEPVRHAILDASVGFSTETAQRTASREAAAKETMIKAGAIVHVPSEALRRAWVDALPEIPKEWAADLEQRGIPGRKVMRAYLAAVREGGAKPLRAWKVE